MLRFKVDENLPKEVAALLAAHGHDAFTVAEQRHAGAADSELSAICKAEARILVTLDLDFSNIRVYPPEEHPGIIVLRLDSHDKDTVLSAVTRVLPLFAVEPLTARLWIVEPGRVRIWRAWD